MKKRRVSSWICFARKKAIRLGKRGQKGGTKEVGERSNETPEVGERAMTWVDESPTVFRTFVTSGGRTSEISLGGLLGGTYKRNFNAKKAKKERTSAGEPNNFNHSAKSQ